MEKLLKLKDVMDYLQVSKMTLQRWDNCGKLKAVRTGGGHRRWRMEDVNKCLKIKDGQHTYGSLYEALCEAQHQADELLSREMISKDVCNEILSVREEIGKRLLDDYFEKTA